MLVYDMQALAVHFSLPAGSEDRPRQVVSIAELIGMITQARRQTKWRRYYLAHRERELARQKAYRATHREAVREYNRHYHRSRKQRRTAAPGQAVLVQEAAKCSM